MWPRNSLFFDSHSLYSVYFRKGFTTFHGVSPFHILNLFIKSFWFRLHFHSAEVAPQRLQYRPAQSSFSLWIALEMMMGPGRDSAHIQCDGPSQKAPFVCIFLSNKPQKLHEQPFCGWHGHAHAHLSVCIRAFPYFVKAIEKVYYFIPKGLLLVSWINKTPFYKPVSNIWKRNVFNNSFCILGLCLKKPVYHPQLFLNLVLFHNKTQGLPHVTGQIALAFTSKNVSCLFQL